MNNSIKKIMSTALAIAMIGSTTAMSVPVSAATNQSAVTASASTSSVKLNTTSSLLTKGYKFTLKLNNATGNVKYVSGDDSIATVNSKGQVVGKSLGKTVIYVYNNGNTYTCNVQVVATKISVGATKVSMDEGSAKKVKITVKGIKNVKATIDDSDVANVSWGKSWNGNSIYLIIKGKNEGSTKIKVYNPDYPGVYKTIKVNVGDTTTNVPNTSALSLTVSQNNMSIDAGMVATFKVNGKAEKIAVESTDPNVAATAVTSAKNGGYDVSVYGYKEGTSMLKIYDVKNPANAVYVTINVKSDIIINSNVRYYQERTYNITNPTSIEVRSESDKICYWIDNRTSQLTYMVVPYNYTPEYSYQYCISLNHAVYTGAYLDGNDYINNLLFGNKSSNYYTRRLYDIIHPKNNPFALTSSDKFVYTIKSNGDIEYIIVPFNFTYDYISAGYNVLNADGTSYYVNTNYYEVSTNPPSKKLSTDKILSWQSYSAKMYYMLVPANYDKVRAETAKARETDEYLYYTVYSSKPVKSDSSDIIIDYWNDNAEDYRYILVPRNYNEDRVERLQDEDIYSTVITSAEANVNEILNAINAERKRSGISELVADTSLMNAAKVRVSELPERFSHKRPNDTSYKTALDEAGVIYKYSDEMIFKNMRFASDTIAELFDDDDYRDSLLNSFNKKIGIAYNSEKNCYVVIVTN